MARGRTSVSRGQPAKRTGRVSRSAIMKQRSIKVKTGAHTETRVYPEQLFEDRCPSARLVDGRAMREDPRERVGVALAGLRPKGRGPSVWAETRPGRMCIEKESRRREGITSRVQRPSDVCGEQNTSAGSARWDGIMAASATRDIRVLADTAPEIS
ncbi:hypothetical protein HETIRDRAFT_429493 [Heterobasidion irregulare TC 32-1]|uniref:Uncharacterized protein n=1 Tax=Heterobasidion irregulare (strain TC 32-1) TaxID=747525 RepID=W4JUD9_HETIT|nr:uncharacterized protein HETIRDRAFT_429493 [Heterobasidion irregulare TC 32-1]ETW77168.1 hypothetical protein HETIRDRAFT_429493 [Heterobasidion irregulare TC 32-1]